jgi:hypothetical protein
VKAEILELGFDGVGDFLVVDESGDALDLLAVPRDENACGVAQEPTELVGGILVADHNPVIHWELLTIYVPACFFDEWRNEALAFIVHGNAENHQAFLTIFLVTHIYGVNRPLKVSFEDSSLF